MKYPKVAICHLGLPSYWLSLDLVTLIDIKTKQNLHMVKSLQNFMFTYDFFFKHIIKLAYLFFCAANKIISFQNALEGIRQISQSLGDS